MLRSSRKLFRSSRSNFGLNRKKRSFPRAWVVLISIPLTLLALELAMRMIIGITGKNTELETYQGEPFNITAYRLKYLNSSGQSYDGLSKQGRLLVKHSPLMGYRLVGNQKNNFWQINPQGFRAEQAIPQAKPKGEVRIFVLGGSTAFGQMSSSNQKTFVGKLETRLNQQVSTQKSNPRKFRPAILPYYADELAKAMSLPPRIRESHYRVVNAAVPGYISSNELSHLALQVLAYQPDFVVLVNGYADLLLPSSQEGTNIPGMEALLTNAPGHFFTNLSCSLQDWFYQSYLIRGFQYWVLHPQDSLHQVIPPIDNQETLAKHLAPNGEELNRRVTRYRNNLQQIARLTTSAKIPLILALQPEVTSRNPQYLSPREKKILDQLGSTYKQKVQTGYAQIREAVDQLKVEFPKGVVAINLNEAYESFGGEAFQDAIHLTDEGNTVLADRLYEQISKKLLLQPKPYGQ